MSTSRSSRRSAAHQRVSHTHSRLRAVGLVLLSLILAGTTAGATILTQLNSSISEHKIEALVDEADRPTENQAPLDQKSGQALNILLMGTDVAVDDTARSDTTMIAHISADRTRIDVVSIPRDTLVTIPSCILGDGSSSYEQYDAMFNSAFSTGSQAGGGVAGGAACAMKTVEALTGIYIDGFAVVDFESFRAIVDTIGGIDMCFTEPINDAQAHITLDAGCHTLDGEQALAIARVRKTLGDGSDIGRISRQHQVVTAIFDKLLSLDPFTDLPTFYSLLQDVTRHVDLSEGLGDLQWLSGLLYSMKSISSDDVNFMTMPWVGAGARVVPAATSQQVWDALIADTPVPEEALVAQTFDSPIVNATPDELEEFSANVGRGVRLND